MGGRHSLEEKSGVRDQRLLGWLDVSLSPPLLPAFPLPMTETPRQKQTDLSPDP